LSLHRLVTLLRMDCSLGCEDRARLAALAPQRD
jgi:hypothetical protein